MRKSLVFLFTLLLVFTPFVTNAVSAHPGKMGANGGHTCWTNCAKWGLKSGQYHYHNADTGTFAKGSSSSFSDLYRWGQTKL